LTAEFPRKKNGFVASVYRLLHHKTGSSRREWWTSACSHR